MSGAAIKAQWHGRCGASVREGHNHTPRPDGTRHGATAGALRRRRGGERTGMVRQVLLRLLHGDWKTPMLAARILPTVWCWNLCRRIERPPFAVWFAIVGLAARFARFNSRMDAVKAVSSMKPSRHNIGLIRAGLAFVGRNAQR